MEWVRISFFGNDRNFKLFYSDIWCATIRIVFIVSPFKLVMSYSSYGENFGETRIERALYIYRNNRIVHLGNNRYIVPSQTSSGQSYKVSYPYRCNCPDYQKRRNACKHILAAGMIIRNSRLRSSGAKRSSSSKRNFKRDFNM